MCKPAAATALGEGQGGSLARSEETRAARPRPRPRVRPRSPAAGPVACFAKFQMAECAAGAVCVSMQRHGDTASVSVTGLHESWQGGHRSQRSPAVWLGPRNGVPHGPRLSNPRVIGTVPASGFPSREPPHPRASEPQSGGAWRTCTFPASSWWCRRCPPGATLCEPLPRASAKTGCWVAEWKRPRLCRKPSARPQKQPDNAPVFPSPHPRPGKRLRRFPKASGESSTPAPELCRRGAWHTRGLG